MNWLREFLIAPLRLLAPSRKDFTTGEVLFFFAVIAVFLIVFYC